MFLILHANVRLKPMVYTGNFSLFSIWMLLVHSCHSVHLTFLYCPGHSILHPTMIFILFCTWKTPLVHPTFWVLYYIKRTSSRYLSSNTIISSLLSFLCLHYHTKCRLWWTLSTCGVYSASCWHFIFKCTLVMILVYTRLLQFTFNSVVYVDGLEKACNVQVYVRNLSLLFCQQWFLEYLLQIQYSQSVDLTMWWMLIYLQCLQCPIVCWEPKFAIVFTTFWMVPGTDIVTVYFKRKITVKVYIELEGSLVNSGQSDIVTCSFMMYCPKYNWQKGQLSWQL